MVSTNDDDDDDIQEAENEQYKIKSYIKCSGTLMRNVYIIRCNEDIMSLKQNSTESHQKRLKTSRDVLVLYIGGPIIFPKFTQKVDNYGAKDTD